MNRKLTLKSLSFVLFGDNRPHWRRNVTPVSVARVFQPDLVTVLLTGRGLTFFFSDFHHHIMMYLRRHRTQLIFNEN